MNLKLIQKHLGRIPNDSEQIFFKSIWNSITKQSQFDSEFSQSEVQSNYNSKLILIAEGKYDPRMIVADNIFLAENRKRLVTIPTEKGSFVLGLSSVTGMNASNSGKHIYFIFGAGIKAMIAKLNKLEWFEGAIPVHKYGLGYALYRLIKENDGGLRLPLKNNDDINILSKKGAQGILVIINRRFENSFNDLIRVSKISHMNLGSITREPNIELFIGQKPVGHIPLSIVDIMIRNDQNLDEIKMQSTIPKYPQPKLKEKKTFNDELKKLVKDRDKIGSIKISQKTVNMQGNTVFFKRGGTTFGAAVNDNKHITYNDYKMKSMAAIANTARQLACAGIRPEVCSGFVTIPDSNQSEKGSFLKGIKDAAQILNLDIKYLSIESGLGLPKGTFCTAGTAIKEGLFPNTFPESDLFISMLGSHRGELGGSHYLSLLNQENAGNRPVVDLMMESRLQDTILTGIQGELIQSARPIGRGGIAVSIAKSLANNKNMGTRVHFSRKLKTEELLFGETQGLVLVTINESDLMEFERVCMTIGIPATTIGRVTNDGIYSFNDSIKVKVEDLN
ncbi:MAG: hypothetical protein HOA15_04510 [Candidatus Marinimicrobia bacterium]|jgi:hypothetical protein|nr:hypothetical protein [Candidatus Neomarinimicrobiota bacterium]MBT3675846.1 hypothetical protein [Candidatus Neomarinimicrobiota bacterium]MBT3763505.1 hypothetical protein [Candidatus Neomarinimicrobiota bacterium]MBT4068593.1 hypothetical protein [Candidatus Neomarinimicrobiota bacterium]MBT4271541.1 hypothetical protein [Candidatus Neomarinimicrobiota bacterium]